MYTTLLTLHTLIRWLVLISLIYAIFSASRGYFKNKLFSKSVNAIRHWTATIAHVQLVIGVILYTQSPVVNYFWTGSATRLPHLEVSFYGFVHILFMLTAIIVLTIGSARAKRRPTDKQKYKTMFIWFSVALILIFMAIPWPFSPFSNRPYFRTF